MPSAPTANSPRTPGPSSGSARRWRPGALLLPVTAFLALAGLAWSGRWEPSLEFSLQETVFYLETPPLLPEGAAPEPPVVNCAARIRVRNVGRSEITTPGHADPAAGEPLKLATRAEWDPPHPRDDGSSCWISREAILLGPGKDALASAFTHVIPAADRNRVRFRVIVEAYRPAAWRVGMAEWVVRHGNFGPWGNDWLLGLLERRPRFVPSPWFEAAVPDPGTLAPAGAP